MYSRFIYSNFKGKDMKNEEPHQYGAFVDPFPSESIKNSEMSISPDLLKLYNEILDIDNSKMKKTFLQTQIQSFADNEKGFYPKLARYIILLSDMQSECQNVEDSKKAVEPVIKKLTENNEKFNEKYDLYNEVHLNENILVQPTLLPLKHRLINLLSSYPENPIVIDILKLIQKIESYEITKSPIAKFCQALEILLNKCEWEKESRDINYVFLWYDNSL